MEESTLGRFLSTTTRVTAILFGVVYFAGFLIVSLHLSSFGVSQFNLLRPHILSAGTLFLFLSVIPAYSGLRWYGLVGPERPKAPGWRPVKHVRSLRLELAAAFTVPCYGLAMFSGVFLLPLYPFSFKDHRGWTVLWVAIAIELVFAVLTNSFFDKLRFVLAPASLVGAGAFYWYMLRYSDSGVLKLFEWYYTVAFLSVVALLVARDPVVGATLQLEMLPLWILALATFYSRSIYGGLRPELGGGAPRTVVLYLSGKVPFSTSSDSAQSMLLDETEGGYFVLTSGDTKTAYFIRRDLVTAIKFEGGSEAVQSGRGAGKLAQPPRQ